MNADERGRLIAKYQDGYRAVSEALDSVSECELDRAADDGWTPRMIVHHLADAEMDAHDHAAQIAHARGRK